MVILLGVLAGLTYGIGDFCGGLSTKRTTVLNVIVGAHLVGLVGAVIASLIWAERFTLSSLVVGGVAGVFGGCGLMLLFRGLAIGPMFVVAPTTAIASASVPAFWDVATGGRLASMAWVGIVLALIALVLVSYVPKQDAEPGAQGKIVLQSLVSGACFGILFILLDWADPKDGAWPLVGARLATSVPIGVFLLTRSRSIRPGLNPSTILLIAMAGTMDTLANGLFMVAAGRGQLATVSVLVSLYPVSTIVMARLVLKERMTPAQFLGLGLALGATALMAAA